MGRIIVANTGKSGPLAPKSAKSFRAVTMTLPPKKAVGKRKTKGCEGLIVILSGKSKVSIGDEEVKADEGSSVYIPPETDHNITNISSGKLHFIYVLSVVATKITTPEEGEGASVESDDAKKESKPNIIKTRKAKILAALEILNKHISKLQKEGVGIASIEKQLIKIKARLKKKDYDDVLRLIIELQDALIKLEMRHRLASKSIKIIEKKASRAKEVGLDLTRVANIISEAQNYMKDGLYGPAMELAVLSSSELESSLKKYRGMVAEKSLWMVQEKTKKISKAGIDLNKVANILSEAQSSMEGGLYGPALELAMVSSSELESTLKDFKKGSRKLQEITKRLENAANIGIDVTALLDMSTAAKDMLKGRKYSEALAKADEIHEILDNLIIESYTTLRSKIESFMKKPDTDISEDVQDEFSSILKKYLPTPDMACAEEAIDVMRDLMVKHFEKPSESECVTVEEFLEEPEDDPAISKVIRGIAGDDEISKCHLCMGKIKAGLEVARCSCGAVYHFMCAKRTETCQHCHGRMDIE